MKVVGQGEVAGDVVSEQRQLRNLGAVGDGERALGMAPFSLKTSVSLGAVGEPAEVELVLGGEAADRRVERRQVAGVERQIAALAGEQNYCPAETVP